MLNIDAMLNFNANHGSINIITDTNAMTHANTTKQLSNASAARPRCAVSSGVLRSAKLKTSALQNIIKLLVIVLSLNSINGFAACCVDMNMGINSNELNTLSASESPKQSMPCHQSSTDNDTIKLANQQNIEESNSVDSCCNACAFTALPIALLVSANTESPEFIPTAFSEFVSLTAAPLFRPPISSLS
jgi:hypothetical protein